MPGHIKKRLDGKWDIVVEVGKDPSTGKRQRNKVQFEGTESQAKKELARLITDVDKGTYIQPSKLTLGEFAKEWLEDCVKPNLSPITYRGYSIALKQRIIPWIGGIRLDKFTPADLRKFYKRLMEEGKNGGKPGPLAPATIKLYRAVIHSILQTAMRDELIHRNVADLVLPVMPPKNVDTEEDIQIQILCENEIKSLEKALSTIRSYKTPYYEIVFLGLRTGLRRGELLALRWDDLDAENCLLKVRRSLAYTPENGLFTKTTKNKKCRTIDVSNEVVELLKRFRAKQVERKFALGLKHKESDLIFYTGNLDYIDPSRLTSWFPGYLKKIGLPTLNFHSLRHTHASLLLKAGVDIKVISERLGHSNIGITYDTYAHLLPGQQKDAAIKLERMLK